MENPEIPLEYAEVYATGWPQGLKTAEDTAPQVGITPERLLELARLRVVPHYRIDGVIYRFVLREVKQWAATHLIQKITGEAIPLSLQIRTLAGQGMEGCLLPQEIMDMQRLLIAVDFAKWTVGSCIYFLCNDSQVLYVGQAVEFFSRLGAHLQDDRKAGITRAYLLPIPREHLNSVEMAFIHLLRPPLNGSGVRSALTEFEQTLIAGLKTRAMTHQIIAEAAADIGAQA